MTKCDKAAQTVINKCLNIQKDETVLILANEPHVEIGNILFRMCAKRSKNTMLMQLSHLSLGKPLSDQIASLMSTSKVVIAVTAPSISHTLARRQACRNGARIVSMPNVTMNTFCRLSNINMERIERLSRKLADILTMTTEAHVSAPNGTELQLSLMHRKGYADTGIIQHPGAFSNLPCGEASIAPNFTNTNGRLIVDCGMGVSSTDQDKLTLSIKEGKAVRISGDSAARRLRQQLSKFGPDSRFIAEFGIGTNDTARISGYTLEDEKVLGTIHIAIGNNVSFGGKNGVPIHLDAVVYKPTVEIDGRQIIDNGRLTL